MATINVPISNGTGSKAILNGNYSVTSNTTGYDNSSILPATQEITAGENNYAFTIAATGTLTLKVTDNDSGTGNPIVGATFVRTDNLGTEYGDAITTDETGTAVFNYVPFDTTTPQNVYFKQTTSDGEHEFVKTVQTASMQASTNTVNIENTAAATRTLTFTDANYANLPIGTGEIILSN